MSPLVDIMSSLVDIKLSLVDITSSVDIQAIPSQECMTGLRLALTRMKQSSKAR